MVGRTFGHARRLTRRRRVDEQFLESLIMYVLMVVYDMTKGSRIERHVWRHHHVSALKTITHSSSTFDVVTMSTCDKTTFYVFSFRTTHPYVKSLVKFIAHRENVWNITTTCINAQPKDDEEMHHRRPSQTTKPIEWLHRVSSIIE